MFCDEFASPRLAVRQIGQPTLHHGRHDIARRDLVTAHAGRRSGQVQRHRLRQHGDTAFASDIGSRGPIGDAAEDRADIDDGAAALPAHRCDHLLAAEKGAVEVDRDRPCQRLGRAVLHGVARKRHAGGIDEDVDPAMRTQHVLDQRRPVILNGNIHLADLRAIVGSDVGPDHHCAFRPKAQGDRRADAGRSPRHDRDLA